MFGLGVGEILVILVIALIFIGPKKLPELAKGLGKGMREFQNAMRGINTVVQNPLDHEYFKEDEKKLEDKNQSESDHKDESTSTAPTNESSKDDKHNA